MRHIILVYTTICRLDASKFVSLELSVAPTLEPVLAKILVRNMEPDSISKLAKKDIMPPPSSFCMEMTSSVPSL